MAKQNFKFFTLDHVNDMNKKKRIDYLFSLVKTGNVVVINGKLNPEDEFELTKKALEKTDKNFSGIEIASLENGKKEEESIIEKIKSKIIDFLVKEKSGITIIGPSKKIKEIKQDPSKLELNLK
jgi:hypothetical protein